MDQLNAAKPGSWQLSPARALMLLCAPVVGLVTLVLLQPREAILNRAFLGAAGALLVGAVAVYMALQRSGRTVALEIVLRKAHYVQASVQAALFAYWGWHVTFVQALVPLVLAQLIFAYGISMVLAWSRRTTFELGFGPFPVTISINFFLVFKPEWFHWQFVIVALGFAAKEFLRWEKNGRSTHIFNPSSFPLAVFSLVLILTGRTDTTIGVEIAQTLFNPPHMHAVIFLVSLVPQILFGVTTMTMAAVFTTYIVGLLYFAATATYFFIDAYIPIAVFLGMHLLFTDPSTSPRSASGRILFGILYGLGTMALVVILRAVGAPPFYDKLLPIPILNLMVLGLDRVAASGKLRLLDVSKLGPVLSNKQRRLAAVGIWAVAFLMISGAGGVGDNHPGQYLPFWQEACQAGSARACDYVPVMQGNFCVKRSGWACNELGIYLAVTERDSSIGVVAFRRGCRLGFPTACENADRMRAAAGGSLVSAPPLLADLPIVLRGSKGLIRERDPEALYALACERGWPGTCGARPTEPQ